MIEIFVLSEILGLYGFSTIKNVSTEIKYCMFYFCSIMFSDLFII